MLSQSPLKALSLWIPLALILSFPPPARWPAPVLPPMKRAEELLRVAGKGVPSEGSRGDLIIRLETALPQKLSNKARKAVAAACERMKSMDVTDVYRPPRFVKCSNLSSGCTPRRWQS